MDVDSGLAAVQIEQAVLFLEEPLLVVDELFLVTDQLLLVVDRLLLLGEADGLHYIGVLGAAEALAFGERAGLDMEQVLEAVTKGAAGSWYLQNRGHTMIADEFDFSFASEQMKDLGLVADAAVTLNAPIPLVELCRQYTEATAAVGENRLDTTAIIRRYR